MGISTKSDGLIQIISDNFDATISSKNGLVSTHALALLLTVAVKSNETKSIETFPHLGATERKKKYKQGDLDDALEITAV